VFKKAVESETMQENNQNWQGHFLFIFISTTYIVVLIVIFINCVSIVFIVCSVFFIVWGVLCAVFCLRVMCYFV
jgi:hypothetical protein